MSEERRKFRIGLDIGMKVDHTALVLVEEESDRAVLRFMFKYKLGSSFKYITDTVADFYNSVKEKGDVYSFTVDATGIGSAPAQMIQQAIHDTRIDNFIFTNKTKRELVGHIKALHSMGKLRFATKKGDEIYNRTLTELINEMRQLHMRVFRNEGESPEIEIFKTGAHDDLFTALALAVKDIRIRGNEAPAPQLIEDKSWAKIPELGSGPHILFT